jgi:hypothetical protein
MDGGVEDFSSSSDQLFIVLSGILRCTFSVLDVCALPKDKGPCPGSVLRWYYDAIDDRCKQFAYGGCQGNPNRFRTQEQCEERCHANNNPPGTAVTVLSTHSM